jgi:hypothetical protein
VKAFLKTSNPLSNLPSRKRQQKRAYQNCWDRVRGPGCFGSNCTGPPAFDLPTIGGCIT